MLELMTMLIIHEATLNTDLCTAVYNHNTQQTEMVHCVTVHNETVGTIYNTMDEAYEMLESDTDQSITVWADYSDDSYRALERYSPEHVYRSLYDPCYPNYEPEC